MSRIVDRQDGTSDAGEKLAHVEMEDAAGAAGVLIFLRRVECSLVYGDEPVVGAGGAVASGYGLRTILNRKHRRLFHVWTAFLFHLDDVQERPHGTAYEKSSAAPTATV